MTLWLQRQEAVDRFTAYLAWCEESLHLKSRTTIAPLPVATSVDPDDADLVRIRKRVTAPAASSSVFPVNLGYKIVKLTPPPYKKSLSHSLRTLLARRPPFSSNQ